MTELSFVAKEFIYWPSTFHFMAKIILSRYSFFAFCFSLCRNRVKDCHDKISSLAIELCLSFVMTFSCWLRHISFFLLEFCVATYKNCVVTQTAAFSTFLLLFCLFSLCLQLTPLKQKVGEYSIIRHTNRYKIVKNMPKKMD